MSLGTRCPKQALRLAKILEYHSAHILQKVDFTHMTHAEILSILKQHFKRVLESAQRLIDTEGTFTKEKVENLTAHLESLDSMVDKEHLDALDALGIERTPEESIFFDEIQKIIKENDLSMPTDSKEYHLLEKLYVTAIR